jgi:Tol biopolymer transport system component
LVAGVQAGWMGLRYAREPVCPLVLEKEITTVQEMSENKVKQSDREAYLQLLLGWLLYALLNLLAGILLQWRFLKNPTEAILYLLLFIIGGIVVSRVIPRVATQLSQQLGIYAIAVIVVMIGLVYTINTKSITLAELDSNQIVFYSDRSVYRYRRLVSASGSLLAIDPNGGRPVILTIDGLSVSPYQVAWSPDGRQMAIRGGKGSQICLFIVDVNGEQCLVEQGFAPSWSRDGRWLAYSAHAAEEHHQALYLIRVDGSEKKLLLESALPIGLIISTWSADSQWLAVGTVSEMGQSEIWLVSADGQETTFLTTGSFPAWSPTREEIAFLRQGALWLHHLADGRETRLFDGPSVGEFTWSPDGERLAFVFRQNVSSEIYRINQDGTDLFKLTNNSSQGLGDIVPSWKP